MTEQNINPVEEPKTEAEVTTPEEEFDEGFEAAAALMQAEDEPTDFETTTDDNNPENKPNSEDELTPAQQAAKKLYDERFANNDTDQNQEPKTKPEAKTEPDQKPETQPEQKKKTIAIVGVEPLSKDNLKQILGDGTDEEVLEAMSEFIEQDDKLAEGMQLLAQSTVKAALTPFMEKLDALEKENQAYRQQEQFIQENAKFWNEVDKLDPEARSLTAPPEFLEWVEKQPTYVQQMANSLDAQAAVAVVNMYREAIAKDKATTVDKKLQEQKTGTRILKSSTSPAPSSPRTASSPEDEFNAGWDLAAKQAM